MKKDEKIKYRRVVEANEGLLFLGLVSLILFEVPFVIFKELTFLFGSWCGIFLTLTILCFSEYYKTRKIHYEVIPEKFITRK